jgi:hypothetical protein
MAFRIHGKEVGDGCLYIWTAASIARSLFFYSEAISCRKNKKRGDRRAVGAAPGAERARPVAAADPLHAGPARHWPGLT